MAVRPLRISWVLRAQLAIGPAPRHRQHLEQLRACGVRAVLSLCSPGELPLLPELPQWFESRTSPLPDHRSMRAPTAQELEQALAQLDSLLELGPVYVHCLASMERSPLLCMGWLIRHRGLSRMEALEYLMQLHPGTSPLPEQLAVLPLEPQA